MATRVRQRELDSEAGSSMDGTASSRIAQVITELVREGAAVTNAPSRFCIKSNSMAPFLTVGDWVVVEAADFGSVHPGDVLLYQFGDHFNCHRLLRKTGSGDGRQLVTKGDATLSPDPAWAPTLLLGRVVAIEKGKKQFHLDRWTWRATNRFLAVLSLGQVSLWRTCCAAKQAIWGSRKTGLSAALIHFLRLPAEFCLRIALSRE